MLDCSVSIRWQLRNGDSLRRQEVVTDVEELSGKSGALLKRNHAEVHIVSLLVAS